MCTNLESQHFEICYILFLEYSAIRKLSQAWHVFLLSTLEV